MRQQVAATQDIDLEMGLYKGMLELREFELRVQQLYRDAKLPGFVHLYIGEEAVATGVCAHLRPDDLIYSTHRGHGHALAKGVPAREVMAELWGKATGCSGGRGGSMHMYAPEYGFMGTNGIVGGGIPLATGSALSAQLRKSGQVVIAFFGDGAVNSGSFHESVNIGGIWNLPVVYVCENNLFATETAFHRATKNTSVASRATAYGIVGVEVDGNDVMAVYQAAGTAIDKARSNGGPTLIECKTYRTVGHHEGDPGTDYRTKDEVESWKRRCPIKTFRDRVLASGQAAPAQLEEINRSVEQWLEDAVEFARTGPDPDPNSVLDHIFCGEQGDRR
jgi:pyruvate dehydrogenase E1 component alpha subunit